MISRVTILTLVFVLTGLVSITAAAFPDGGDPEGGEYPVAAYLCDSDPGNWSPYSARPIGGGCEPLEGVTFSAALESDGVELDTCTTDEDGTCAVDVPAEAPLLITEDVSTLPDGYAPRENPVGGYNYTEFRGSRTYNLPEGAPLTPTPAAMVSGSTAGIYAGTCADLDLDTPVAGLEVLQVPDGVSWGAEVAAEAERSYSSLDLTFDDLTDGSHAVVVFDQDDATVPLACGEIAGTIGFDGLLIVPLRAQGDSLYSGIATLLYAPSSTDVVIYLAADLDGSGI